MSQTEVVEETEAEHALRAGFVAIVGQPNVGKSTLMNQILGVKLAITTHRPQTTRNRILGVQTYSERGQIAFLDTPGIHTSRKRLNQAIVRVAVDSLQEVDAVCHLIDAPAAVAALESTGDPITESERHVQGILENTELPRVLVLNKIDRVKPRVALLPLVEALQSASLYNEIVPVSARSGENLERLEEVLLGLLPAGPAMFPEEMITDQAERFVAAEYIREQIMLLTNQELPYSAAVEIDRFEEVPRKNLLEISAIIHVERDSQKGIIIGARGARIKDIGARSRRHMEQFFGKRVFLETLVRVQSNWSEDPRALHRFGYE